MSTRSREQGRSQKAAAIRAEQARRERTRRVGITVAIVVAIAVVIAGGFWLTRDRTPAAAPSNLTVRADGSGLVLGRSTAPVKVVVYEDFLCPYCQQFERQTRGFLHADAAAGKVLVEYRPFQLLDYDYSTLALNAWGQVLRSGTPKQALAFHDALYDNQPYEQEADKYGVPYLRSVGKKAGLPASLTDGFGTQDPSIVAAAQKAAAGIRSTPTITVGGKPLQGADVDALVGALQDRIAAG